MGAGCLVSQLCRRVEELWQKHKTSERKTFYSDISLVCEATELSIQCIEREEGCVSALCTDGGGFV